MGQLEGLEILGGFQGVDKGCEHVLDYGLLLVADRSLEAAHLELE